MFVIVRIFVNPRTFNLLNVNGVFTDIALSIAARITPSIAPDNVSVLPVKMLIFVALSQQKETSLLFKP